MSDDEKVAKIVTPEEYAARMQPIVDRCTRRVGLMALLEEDHRLLGKGTVFFVMHGERRLVCTARHVVRESIEDMDPRDWPFTSHHLRVMTFKREESLRSPSIPVGFDLAEQDLVWEDARLDVAVFNAPAELVSSGMCDFSDAKADAVVAGRVRNRWSSADSEQSSLNTFIVGFPNIMHRVDPSTHTEWLGLVPMTGYIISLDRDSYNGPGQPALQMMVELDPGTPTSTTPEPYRLLAGDWRETLLSTVAKGERPPLGGFSGAPLFVAHQHGESIIGVMKEGSPQFGARIVAMMSCWDDVMSLMERELGY